MDATNNAVCKGTIQETKEDGDKSGIPRENKRPEASFLAWLGLTVKDNIIFLHLQDTSPFRKK